MRIGIDARLYGSRNGGIGRYLEKLLSALPVADLAASAELVGALDAAPTIAHDNFSAASNQYVILLTRDNFDDYQPLAANFQKILADYRPYSWREQVFLPRILKRAHCDVWHFPHWNVPWSAPRPFIATIHDLILTHYPNRQASTLPTWLFNLKMWFYDKNLRRVLRHATRVIAVSEFTRQDILRSFENFKIAPEKITTIYEGVTGFNCHSGSRATAGLSGICERTDSRLRGNDTSTDGNDIGTPPPPAAPYPPVAPYFLYVGNSYPHKNLEILLKSYKLYREQYRGVETDIENLVLVSWKNFFQQRLKNWARENQLDEGVIFAEQVADEDLAGWYAGAKAYIFPSLYEGFGLPPLEAMNYGVPVAAARASCLPEILGDAALYFDPQDTQVIAGTLNQIASDENLRQRLIAAGRAQIKNYQWEKTARETLAVIQQAAHAQKEEKNFKET